MKKIIMVTPRGWQAHNDNVWSFDVEKEKWELVDFETPYETDESWFFDGKRELLVFPMRRDRKKNSPMVGFGVYDPKKREFRKFGATRPFPGKVGGGNDEWVYDFGNDLYFGWGSRSGNENWTFDPKSGRWKQFLPEKNIPVRKQLHWKLEYDAKNKLIVVCRQEKGAGQWFALRFEPKRAKFAERSVPPRASSDN
jgi:hypothetical protein